MGHPPKPKPTRLRAPIASRVATAALCAASSRPCAFENKTHTEKKHTHTHTHKAQAGAAAGGCDVQISHHRSETPGCLIRSPWKYPHKYGFNRGFNSVENGFRPSTETTVITSPVSDFDNLRIAVLLGVSLIDKRHLFADSRPMIVSLGWAPLQQVGQVRQILQKPLSATIMLGSQSPVSFHEIVYSIWVQQFLKGVLYL